MKSNPIHRFWGQLVVLTALVCLPPAARAAEGIAWQALEPSFAIGKQERRKLFLYFFADWCTYCKQMERTTFRDPAVVAMLNQNFVPVRINADREAAVAARYRVQPLPTIIFLTPEGQQMSRPGFIPAEQMMVLLRYVQTDSYRSMSLQQFAAKPGGG